jgi:iron complex transport system permease protein
MTRAAENSAAALPYVTPAPPAAGAAGHWSIARLLITLAASAAVWALLALVCLLVGSTRRFGWPDDSVVLSIRLDNVLLASLVGAALAAAGVVYQSILRNPLADPYLLGVSTGATLFAFLWQFPAATAWLAALGGEKQFLGQQAMAFIGAVITVAVVFALASGRGGRIEPVTLLLVGVIVNAVNGAIFLLLNALVKDPATPGGPLALLVGGIQQTLPAGAKIAATICVGVGWIAMLYIAGQLHVAGLSDAEAGSLGVRIHRLRWVALIVASLVTAAAVSVSGPIGFVGLVCPHLARLVVGNDPRRLLPLATALGAGLLAAADAASRVLTRPEAAGTALPVGVLTGLVGGPFFLVLLLRSRRMN